jgi:hypothetical protein
LDITGFLCSLDIRRYDLQHYVDSVESKILKLIVHCPKEKRNDKPIIKKDNIRPHEDPFLCLFASF